MSIRVRHSIDRLAADMADIPVEAKVGLVKIARENANYGRDLAKADARPKAGAHGKHYPKSITSEMISPLVWEYGPDSAMPQGGMSFEFGSRNQRGHLSLAISADKLGPATSADIRKLVTRLFW